VSAVLTRTVLHWSIKTTFVDYVNRLPDGRCDLEGGVTQAEDGLAFPAAATEGGHGHEQFSGTVVFTGHHGLLRISIADPCIEHDGRAGRLTIADPDWPGRRMQLASFERTPADGHDAAWTGSRVELTSDGADLFYLAYAAGDGLDDFVVRPTALGPDDQGGRR
jgi:hypothetical protein